MSVNEASGSYDIEDNCQYNLCLQLYAFDLLVLTLFEYWQNRNNCQIFFLVER